MQNTRGIPNPCGADGEIRTPDLPLTRRPLYQLSYTSGYVLLYAERTVFICPGPARRPARGNERMFGHNQSGASRGVLPPLSAYISGVFSPEKLGPRADWTCRPIRERSSPSPQWSEWWGSNPRPHGPKPCALSTALHPDVCGHFSPRWARGTLPETLQPDPDTAVHP